MLVLTMYQLMVYILTSFSMMVFLQLAQKAELETQPEKFLMENKASFVEAFPMLDSDEYVRGVVGYSEGSEQVLNGTFDTDLSGFAQHNGTHWVWINKRAYHPLATSFYPIATSGFIAGQICILRYDYEVLNGKMQVSLRTSNNTWIEAIADDIEGVGTNTHFIIANSNTDIVSFYRNYDGITISNFEGYIDNVSITPLSGIYPITNWVTGMNKTGIPYGLQASKLEIVNNVPIAYNTDKLSLYGGEYIDTGWVVDFSNDVALEFSRYVDNRSDTTDWDNEESGLYSKFKITTSKYSGGWCQIKLDDNLYQFSISQLQGTIIDFLISVDSSSRTFDIYINGVLEQTVDMPKTVVDAQHFPLGCGLDWVTGGRARNFTRHPIIKFEVHTDTTKALEKYLAQYS